MVGTNATELPLCLFLSDRLVDIDGIVSALSGAAALIHSCDEGSRVEEIVRAARIIRDVLPRLDAMRETIDRYELVATRDAFDLTDDSDSGEPSGRGL